MGHEVKWVGYLGCLTWRVIHFGMGLYFCLGVAERTYTWREDWMSGLEQGFELGDEVKWVGYLGCLEWWDNHFEMALTFWLGCRWEDLYLLGRLNGWARARIWVGMWSEMGGILGVSLLMKHSFWDGFLFWVESRWEDLYLKGRLNEWARARIWVGRWGEMGGILGVSRMMRQSFWDGFDLLAWVSLRGLILVGKTEWVG